MKIPPARSLPPSERGGQGAATAYPLEVMTPSEMARADATCGVAVATLVQHAGRAVARAVMRAFRPVPTVVLCGPGQNGADGQVAARLLAEAGWPVRAAAPTGPEVLRGARLVIDAVFGAGLSRPVEGAVAETLAAVSCPLVAIDLPSGVSGLTGQVLGFAPQAALTVTFFRLKPGHLLLPGRALCGTVVLADIGIPATVLEAIRPATFLNGPKMFGALPRPGAASHKWSRGAVTLVAGAMPGATRLAAAAAQRAGAGHVSVVTDAPAAFATDPGLVRLDPAQEPAALAEPRRRVWLVGPGGGEGAPAALARLLAAGRTVVADADALHRAEDLAGVALATPHEAEFARSFGPVGEDRVAAVRAAASRMGGVVLLKGASTVIAAPDGRAAINANAPPWLATAGSGDVLAGAAAALLAQGMAPFEGACAAAWLCGAVAQALGQGLVAADLPEAVALAMASLDGGAALPLLSAP
jgi:ADP-dependent NAD(P)H-hydrate dehydratase / NAD(P)H-hydrate epimerase